MKYLLDTNVISTYATGKTNQRVDAWLQQVDDRDLYLSDITFMELWYGAYRLPLGKRRAAIEHWIETDLSRQFHNRVASFGPGTAQHYGLLLARAEKKGHTADPLDTMIAAIAVANGMTVVTLNRKHFERLGVAIVDL